MRPLLLLLFLLPAALGAQPGTDEQLATQYFQQGDYERALLYYEKLYRQNNTPFFYDQLLKSYTALQRYDDAEKLAKERVRRSDDPKYLIDLGGVYKLMGDEDKARQQYDKALKDMRADQNGVRTVANAFSKEGEYDRAIEAYERGQKLLRNDQIFNYELATLYAAKGDMERMITSFMDLLAVNENYIQSVQNSLGRYIDFEVRDERSDLLRTELLRRIQRDPSREIYQDLLIWMYVQQKDLTSAFVQSKAMDKRSQGNGDRLMELGDIALSNHAYGTAVKCYQYVADLGGGLPNYPLARIGLVQALNEEVTAQAEPAQEDLIRLRDEYRRTLDELGRLPSTVKLMRGLARVEAYHLNETPAARSTLEQALALPNLEPATEAQLKLDLADVHVLDGDIWEASLLYSQVDLEFKYDLIGHEARFRNARVSFYAGDFLWCQAQLDVLKASTSKLIANDAMELSLLISDNLGLDSNSVPLSHYARAELLVFQHRYDEALDALDSLELEYPMHSLGDEILYQRHHIAYARQQYDTAAVFLEKLLELYPLDILVDNALLDLGRLYEDKLNDPEKAQQYYEKLLFEQSGSIFVPEARERFRRLRGDLPAPEEVPAPPASDPHP